MAAGTGPVIAPAPAVGAAPLNGGSRLTGVMAALATASSGSNINKPPVGSGVFLLQSGKYFVSEVKGTQISAFKMLCLVGGTDAAGISHGTPHYTGPVPGEVYDVSFFIDMTPTKQKYLLDRMVGALQCCMGWDQAKTKLYQSTPDGLQKLSNLLIAMFCYDINTGQGTGQASCFSNQVVLQLNTKASRSAKKVNGQPVYDATGAPVMSDYENTYWEAKIPLADIHAALGDAGVIEAFGTAEAWAAAVQTEANLATM